MLEKRTVKVGFVGAGWMGSVQMKRIVEHPDAEIVALFEKNAQRGQEVLESLGLSKDLLVDDFDKIINNPEVDAVWLVSPNSFHGPQSIAAMQAGKHVFCEKPCATKFDDFCKQIQLAQDKPELKTFVDYLINFDTMENKLRKMIADGDFGKITQIQINYRHPVNIVGDKVWKLSREIMGDAIGMGIIHSLSTMVTLMSSQAKPVGVYATNLEAQVRGFEAEPIYNILIKFDNGATGFCFGNIDSSNGYDAYHNISGTKGGFIFDSQTDRTHKVRYWSEKISGGKWVWPLDSDKCKAEGFDSLCWPEDTTTPDSGDVVEHQTDRCVAHFIECINENKRSFLDFENSAIVAEIGWAAQISAATGKEVALPLNKTEAKKFFDAQ